MEFPISHFGSLSIHGLEVYAKSTHTLHSQHVSISNLIISYLPLVSPYVCIVGPHIFPGHIDAHTSSVEAKQFC